MHPALRLATNNLVGRPNRTALLVGAVALSTVLVASIACALASLNAGLDHRVEQTIGRADIRVKHIGEERFDRALYDTINAKEGVRIATPRAQGPLPLVTPDGQRRDVAVCRGIDPQKEYALIDPSVDDGREVRADNELVIDRVLAESLGLGIGDRVEVERFGPPMSLTVVGIRDPKTFQPVEKPRAETTIATLEEATGISGRLTEIGVMLEEPGRAEELADAWSAELPEAIMARPTERVTSNIGQTVRANRFMFVLASILAYIAAAFIVLTGLTTNLLERQRELAIMRCIGGRKLQLALAQLASGGGIGLFGALLGIPAGILLAWIMTRIFPDRLPAGLVIWPAGLVFATIGAVAAGIIGAVAPAVSASRTKPLHAMASHAKPATRRGIAVLTLLGLLGILAQLVIINISDDGATVFWAYSTTGLPLMFIGYFLLGVPVSLIVATLTAPLISRLLKLPGSALLNSVRATPVRNGLTAGALMVGLAMMTSIWTNGSSLLRDWLGAIQFPDAFARSVSGPMSEADRDEIAALDVVGSTCAITLQRIESDAFGFKGLAPMKTTFVAFEPEPFFEMANLHWIAGDPEYAMARLRGDQREEKGPAVLVAKEFLVKREGYEVGKTFTVEHMGERIDFEIVGVISSPGLDIVKKYFDIGKEYADRAMHSVFGSRDDLKRIFHNDAIDLVQIGLRGDVSDAEAVERIRGVFENTAVAVGSGREIKQDIMDIGYGSMRVATVIAIGAMLIGCFGVGNVVVAGIDARRFEFGVMRAVGANGSLLARFIIGEVLILALTACVLGTLLGIQGSYAGVRLYSLLAGLDLSLKPPLAAIAIGWLILITLTIAAILPIVHGISTCRALDLLRARAT